MRWRKLCAPSWEEQREDIDSRLWYKVLLGFSSAAAAAVTKRMSQAGVSLAQGLESVKLQLRMTVALRKEGRRER